MDIFIAVGREIRQRAVGLRSATTMQKGYFSADVHTPKYSAGWSKGRRGYAQRWHVFRDCKEELWIWWCISKRFVFENKYAWFLIILRLYPRSIVRRHQWACKQGNRGKEDQAVNKLLVFFWMYQYRYVIFSFNDLPWCFAYTHCGLVTVVHGRAHERIVRGVEEKMTNFKTKHLSSRGDMISLLIWPKEEGVDFKFVHLPNNCFLPKSHDVTESWFRRKSQIVRSVRQIPPCCFFPIKGQEHKGGWAHVRRVTVTV